jgi:hypothetical protein
MPRSRRAASHLTFLLGLALLAGCAASPPAADSSTARRMAALLPADAVLLGEQHDAPEHHVIERETVEALVARGRLAALTLEMAEEGNGTGHLPADATEEQVRTALSWNDKGWPWAELRSGGDGRGARGRARGGRQPAARAHEGRHGRRLARRAAQRRGLRRAAGRRARRPLQAAARVADRADDAHPDRAATARWRRRSSRRSARARRCC